MRRIGFAFVGVVAAVAAVGVVPVRGQEVGAQGGDVALAARASTARLGADVAWLADPERVGRRAGEPGERAAGDWIAARLAELGLEPAGTDGWFHAVDVPLAPRDLGSSHVRARLVTAPEGVLQKAELRPLGCSAPGEAAGALAFAGFGLVAPGAAWDDYADLDVAGKVVLVARGAPEGPKDAPLDFGAAAGLFSKVMAAKRRGAVAVLLAQHPSQAGEPLPEFDAGQTSLSTLPALAIDVAFAEVLVPGYAAALEGLERRAAEGAGRTAPELTGALPSHVEVFAGVSRERGTARNVLGLLRGSDPEAPLVVVGAHYDHLGHGHTGSLVPHQIGQIHPGADDNASGTAAVLEAARLLKQQGTRSDVLIALWSGEELGLLGSKRWIADANELVARTSINVNLDMVGRVRDGKLTVLGAGSSPAFEGVLPELGGMNGLLLALEPSGRAIGGSDHQSFLEKQIPALHLFSGLHADYHKPSDTAEKIELDGLARVADFTVDLVAWASEAGRLEYSEVVATAEPGRARGEQWRVWFGSVPEYGDAGPGLLISGTSSGSPAERAGLLGGDRIVQVGDIVIEGMADFIHVLQIHKPGEVVRVVFQRDGEQHEVLLTLTAREGT